MKNLKQVAILMSTSIIIVGLLVGCGKPKYTVEKDLLSNSLVGNQLDFHVNFEDEIGDLKHIKPILIDVAKQARESALNGETNNLNKVYISAADYYIKVEFKGTSDNPGVYRYGFVEKDLIHPTKENHELDQILEEVNAEYYKEYNQ